MLAVVLPTLLACTTPDAAELTGQRGRNALDERRFDLARAYLEIAVVERPDDAALCMLFARSWSSGMMQSPVRAIEAWERCREIEPSDEASIGIAQGHVRLGAHAEALAALEGVDGTDAAVLRGEALLHLDPEKALQEIARATERFPDHAPLRKLAGRTAHLAEEFEAALTHVERALELDPLDGRMHYLDGRLRQQFGDGDAAAAAFERHQWTSRIAGSGGWPEAPTIEKLRLLEQLSVRTPVTDVLTIEWMIEVGRRNEAAAVAERLLSSDRATPSNLLRAEAAIAGLGLFPLATRLLDRADADAEDPTVLREVAYRRAHLLYLQDEPEAALGDIERLLEADPSSARVLDLRARVYMGTDDDAAAEDLSRALELAPWRLDSRLALAEIEVGRDRRARAEALLSEAPEPSPAINQFRRRHGLD